MRGHRSGLMTKWLFFVTVCTAVPAGAAEDSANGQQVEIFRYAVAPRVVLGKSAQEKLSTTMPFGELGVDAYLVVVRLAPGDRFVSARAEVRDGFFCIPRRGRGSSIAGKIAAQLAYQAVLSKTPPAVRESLALVSALLPLDHGSALPPPRLKRRMVLKAKNVEHHDGYVAVLLLVAANSVTRLHVERVVTRSDTRSGKRRSREARTVALPDKSEKGLNRGRIMSILADGEDDLDPWRRF